MSRWLDQGVTVAWLAVLAVAAFSAGAASEGAAQWLWPIVVIAAAIAQILFNAAQQRRRQHDREWLGAIIDAVPYPLFYKGPDSRYLGINDIFSRTFAVGRNQVVGRSDADLFGAPLHERFVAQDRSLIASGESGTFEESMVVDGGQRTFEARKTPFYDKDGALLGIVGVAVDVTENRKQQRDLKDMNQRLQEALSLLEQSRIDFDLALQAGDLGVWRTEFSNDDLVRDLANLSNTSVEWDVSARRIAGLAPAVPLTKRDILGVVHPGDRHRLWAAIVAALQTGGRFADYGRLVRPDGSIRTVAVRAAVTYWPNADGNGVVRGLTGILRDVTDEEAIKSELERKAKEAQDAEQAKSRFLAMMSHEIRTPMNGIIGMLELVMMQDMNEEQRYMLEGVKDSAFVLLAILNDILDFSKIEAGHLEVECAPYLLPDVVEGVALTWRAKAANKGITFDLSVDSCVPRCIRGDRVRLYQVLTNLVGNAVKFTHTGGVALRVSASAPQSSGAGEVRFDVEDTGIGIDVVGQARLFEPFQQADVSTTRNFGGTGLGLSIVKSLVEAMGGTVSCASTPGVGSRFSVVLPVEAVNEPETVGPDVVAARSRSVASVAPSRDREEQAGRLILVAEDNAMNREVIGRQLAALGYCADMAEDGEEAWTCLRSGARYGLLLVDGHMPRLDGYQLVERIRSHERGGEGGRLKVLAITANALTGERARCLAAGMDDCLTKPLQIGELDRVLRHYLPQAGIPSSADEGEALSGEGGPLGGRPGPESKTLFAPLQDLVGGDSRQFTQLVSVFLQVAGADMAALDCVVRAHDWPAVRELAHRMKSTFSQVGDAPSESCFARLEHAADDALKRNGLLWWEEAQQRAKATLALAKERLPAR